MFRLQGARDTDRGHLAWSITVTRVQGVYALQFVHFTPRPLYHAACIL